MKIHPGQRCSDTEITKGIKAIKSEVDIAVQFSVSNDDLLWFTPEDTWFQLTANISRALPDYVLAAKLFRLVVQPQAVLRTIMVVPILVPKPEPEPVEVKFTQYRK